MSAEGIFKEALAIEVPAVFAHEASGYRAGVMVGRVEVCEDIAKYAAAILARAEALLAAGQDNEAKKLAACGEAVNAFAVDFVRRIRGQR